MHELLLQSHDFHGLTAGIGCAEKGNAGNHSCFYFVGRIISHAKASVPKEEMALLGKLQQ